MVLGVPRISDNKELRNNKKTLGFYLEEFYKLIAFFVTDKR